MMERRLDSAKPDGNFGPIGNAMVNIIEPFEAQQVLETFRQGTVSKEHASTLMIGREFWIDALTEDLDFVARGASKIRFLSAPYGGGKSHFLAAVEKTAAEKDFLVANVELHAREAPLDKFEVIFPKIMRSLRSKDSSQVLDIVFARWLESKDIYDRQSINEATREVSSSLDFQAALRGYVERADSELSGDREVVEAIFGWLLGDAVSPELRKLVRIRNRITATNATEIFGSFLALVRQAGFSGLAVFLDEAEAVTSLAQSRKRNEANQNLRKLLDNADHSKGYMIVFATTPAFLTDQDRGAQSYAALWDRIRTVIKVPKGSKPNKRNLIIELEPPGRGELQRAGEAILQLHSVAYSWSASDVLTRTSLKQLVDSYLNTDSTKVYRLFLRVLIGILDALEQSPNETSVESLMEVVSFDSKSEGD